MYPPLIDAGVIVYNMRRASSLVPIVAVHGCGRPGNCAYILMDYVRSRAWPCRALASIKHRYSCSLTAFVEPQVLEISRRLSSMIFKHRNMVMDDTWHIIGVLD